MLRPLETPGGNDTSGRRQKLRPCELPCRVLVMLQRGSQSRLHQGQPRLPHCPWWGPSPRHAHNLPKFLERLQVCIPDRVHHLAWQACLLFLLASGWRIAATLAASSTKLYG